MNNDRTRPCRLLVRHTAGGPPDTQNTGTSSTICPDLSARIVTHVLMSTGHFPAAIAAASSHAAGVEREPAVPTPEGLSVRGSSCCAGRSQPPRTASATSI
jgi:hypothetical protein